MGGRGSSSGMRSSDNSGSDGYTRGTAPSAGGARQALYTANSEAGAINAIRNGSLMSSEHNTYRTTDNDGPSVMTEYHSYRHTVKDTSTGVEVGGEINRITNVAGNTYWQAESPFMGRAFPDKSYNRPNKSNGYSRGYVFQSRSQAENALRTAVEYGYNAERRRRG